MARGGRNEWLIAVVCVAVAGAGCAVNRPTLTTEELERRREEYMSNRVGFNTRFGQRILHRWRYEYDQYVQGKTSGPPVWDVLIISGGGDYGAFGAGFLQGWSTCGDEDHRRPDFDMVTGVSTGALIAPFAFVGTPETIKQIDQLYRDPSSDWVIFRGLFAMLPGNSSFLDNRGLARDIKEQVNWDIIREIAKRSQEDKVLLVGATNLDLGTTHIFNLTREAEKAVATNDYDRIHKMLLASAAIPAAFPPVVIDDTLFVDGGTTSNILITTDVNAPWSPIVLAAKEDPTLPIPKLRFWVIINNQLHAVPQVIQPTWPSITSAAVQTAVRSATITALRVLTMEARYVQATLHLDVEVKFVAIPDDWRPPRPGIFQRETMVSLADLGQKLGADPQSWKEFGFERIRPSPEAP